MVAWLATIELQEQQAAFIEGSVDGPFLVQLTAEARLDLNFLIFNVHWVFV